jgi:hypothetical protein
MPEICAEDAGSQYLTLHQEFFFKFTHLSITFILAASVYHNYKDGM